MHKSYNWAIRPGYNLVIAVGFSSTFRSTLVDLAKTYSKNIQIALRGEQQPYVPIYGGVVHKHLPLSGVVLETLLAEFPNMTLGVMKPKSVHVHVPDGSVYCELSCKPGLKKYRRIIASILRPQVSENGQHEVFQAMARLGKNFREEEQIVSGATCESKYTVPTSMAVGYADEDYIFHRHMWISVHTKEVKYSSNFHQVEK